MFLWLFSILVGCKNDCQRLCDEMLVFAEECNQKFTEQMHNECLEKQGQKEATESCSNAYAKLVDRSEWECEDLDVFFDDPTATENSSEE